MRDSNRISRIAEALQGAWEANPDQRLAQLVLNAAREMKPKVDPFYVEDNEIEMGLWRLMGKRISNTDRANAPHRQRADA